MALRAVEHSFTGTTTPYTSYDSTKTTLGKWIIQNTGSNLKDKWAGPFEAQITRPAEISFASSFQYVFAIGTLHWVFLADQAAAAATRRINLYTFDTSSFIWNWRGFITLTYPTATNHTIRGLRVARHLHTTGTVSSSGTTITGSGTDWSTNRMAAGARIGFGTTDPTAVVDWYHISSIASDTSLTVSLAPSTISAGTSYVIEELRVYTVTTNATTTNGGLFVTKGINFDDFITTGTTISAATTTDNIKAVYWLADASTVTNTASGGIAFGGTTATNTNHDIYVINADATSTARMYKYNGRASLSGLSSGKSTSAFSFKTNAMTVSGTIQQNSCLLQVVANHGPGSGVSSLYFNTTTRIYRCKETSIRGSSSNFIDDNKAETPPGGTSTFPASNNMNNFSYVSEIDRFILNLGSTGRAYLTRYDNIFGQFDRIFGVLLHGYDYSNSDPKSPLNFNTSQTSTFYYSCDGILYISKPSSSSSINQLYALPISLDWDFASSNYGRLYTPEIPVVNCSNLKKIFINCQRYTGSDVFAFQNEPFRVFYRTNGISDNTGCWTSISSTGDLSSVKDISSIQFMFEFKVFGTTMLTSKIHSLTLTYNDYSTNTYFQPSAGKSSTVSKRFAWRFSTAYGTTVPTLTIRIFDIVSGKLLITDTTSASLYGTWQKSTDGTTWESYNSTDKSNENTYIRYIPTTLADNIKVKVILT